MSLKSFAYYDLVEAFGQSGCAVCRLLSRDVARMLDSIVYEYSLDRDMQARFRGSRGLCAEHGNQLTSSHNPLAVAVLYEQSLHEVLGILESPAAGDRAKRAIGRLFNAAGAGTVLADALEPTRTCLVCETRDKSESMFTRSVAEDFADEALQAALHGSDGLCLHHFRGTLRWMSDARHVQALTAIHSDIWTRLRAELHEFMRKSDSNHADEPMGAEGTSWQRVIRRLSGEPRE